MRQSVLPLFFGIVTLFLVWAGISKCVPEMAFPGPKAVCSALMDSVDIHAPNAVVTALEAGGGLIIAAFGSAVIVMIIGLFPRAEAFFYPAVTLLKASPVVAFVPVFIVLVGFGAACKVLVSALIAFFPLVIGGVDGLRKTPERLLIMAEGYGVTRFDRFRYVTQRYAWLGFLSGLKTAAPLSVVGAIVGEYVAGGLPYGLGQFIMSQTTRTNMTQVFAAALVASVIGMLFFLIAFIVCWGVESRSHVDK